MKKFVCGFIAAVMLACSLPITAMAIEDSKHYTIDLESVDDKTWKDCRVSLSFLFNGNNTVNAYLSDRTATEYQPYWNETMGRPVLLDYTVDETTQQKMAITFVPIRLIVDCIPATTIDWVTKTDTEEAHAVIHTTNGDVKLYVNATQIEYTDDNGQAQVYEETTYRFPDGSPIPLCLVRQNRIYVPVRAISTFLLDSESVHFDWRRPDYLLITANTKGHGPVQKTYGVNTNYLRSDGAAMNWMAMPNLMAALEGTDWVMDNQDRPELPSDGVYVNTKSEYGASRTLGVTYVTVDANGNKALKIKGFAGLKDDTQLKVLNAAFTDLLCDADRNAIMSLLNEIVDNLSEGWTRKGLAPKAQTWLNNFALNYSYSEVTLEFEKDEYGAISTFVIKTK